MERGACDSQASLQRCLVATHLILKESPQRPMLAMPEQELEMEERKVKKLNIMMGNEHAVRYIHAGLWRMNNL